MLLFYNDLCFHINSLREKVWKKTVTFIILITNSIKSYGDKHKKKKRLVQFQYAVEKSMKFIKLKFFIN